MSVGALLARLLAWLRHAHEFHVSAVADAPTIGEAVPAVVLTCRTCQAERAVLVRRVSEK
jgi:hypothetical protein